MTKITWFENPAEYTKVINELGIPEGEYLSIISSVKKVGSLVNNGGMNLA